MYKRIFFIILIFFLNLRSVVYSKSNNKFDLRYLINLSLKNNFEIKKINDECKKKHYEKQNRFTQILIPNINAKVETNFGYLNSDYLQKKDFDFYKNHISYSQIRWDIMSIPKKIHNYKIASQNSYLHRINQLSIIEKIIQQTIEKYYTLMLEKKNKEVLEKFLDLCNEKSKIIKKRFKSGAISKNLLFETNIEKNLAITNLLERKEKILIAEYELKKIVGSLDIDIKDIEESLPKITYFDFNTTLEKFEEKNSEIKILESETKLKKLLNQKRGLNLVYPKIYTALNFSLENQSSTDYKNTNSPNDYNYLKPKFNVSIGISFDFFQIIRAIHQRNIFDTDHKFSIFKQIRKKQELRQKLLNSFKIYEHYYKNIKLAKDNLDLIDKSLKMTYMKFKKFKIGNLELKICMQNQREAKLNYLTCLYKTKIYESKLKMLTGCLLNEYYLR